MKRNLASFSFLSSLFFIFSILILGSIIGFSNQNETTFETEGKVYITPGCVYVAPNGIFININGEFVAVNCLLADDQGVYILADSLGPEAKSWKTWTCQSCGRSNSFLTNKCKWPDCSTNQNRK